MKKLGQAVLFSLFAGCLAGAPALGEDYFKGKTIVLYAGQPAGGGIDAEMRLTARFLGNFIPGAPSVQPRNMPGAGGLVLGAHIYSIAAPDGLTLGMPGRAGFVLPAATGDPNARFDLTKFAWIGSSASTNYILWLRKDLGIPTLEALRQSTKQAIVGGAGTNTANAIVPEVLARYEHLPIKVIRGYPGTVDVVQAIEHNEVHGIFAHRASLRQDMIETGFVTPLFQTFAIEKNLPAVENFVTDPEEKAILGLLNAPLKLGLPLITAPATPPDILATLRDAYAKMAASPDYQEAAAKQGFDVGQPNSGEELEDYARAKLASVPESVLKQYRALVDR